MRVFVGPHEIAGYYTNLTAGLKTLGINVDYITYNRHRFGYTGEGQQPLLLKAAKWFNKFRRAPRRSFLVKVFFAIPGEVLLAIWVVRAATRYDVFIFGFGQSLHWSGADLWLLKLLRKRIISNLAHGSEARPPFMNGGHLKKDGVPLSATEYISRANTIKKVVRRHFKYACTVIGAPLSTSQYARGRFINLFEIGLPLAISEDKTIATQEDGEKLQDRESIRILHAPTHVFGKGSSVISSAIESLKKKGHVIDFVLIQGRPFQEVIREIERCDFVVDQVYSDTPMAAFATEAAWFGKPAVVGGYGFDILKKFISEDMWPPTKICHPEKIEIAIEELIIDVEQRKLLGMAAQAFVRKKWNADEVAKRFLRLIQDDIPERWFLDPDDITYLEGWGQPRGMTQQVIKEMVALYGVSSLQLSHRADLENKFLKFSGMDSLERSARVLNLPTE